MSLHFGPFVQMGKLAEYMAQSYQMDRHLALQPLIAHFMEEVDINIASDTFDHTGFMNHLRRRLEASAETATDPRRQEFLQGVVSCLLKRIEQTSSSGRLSSTAPRTMSSEEEEL
jgi:hypothetical protein